MNTACNQFQIDFIHFQFQKKFMLIIALYVFRSGKTQLAHTLCVSTQVQFYHLNHVFITYLVLVNISDFYHLNHVFISITVCIHSFSNTKFFYAYSTNLNFTHIEKFVVYYSCQLVCMEAMEKLLTLTLKELCMLFTLRI